MYAILVGEIGLSRHEVLYELRWWEVRAILRGYNRRDRQLLSLIRWQTYWLTTAQVGSEQMEKANIYGPADMLTFPWDIKTDDGTPISTPQPSDEEIERLRALMREENAKKNEVNPRP